MPDRGAKHAKPQEETCLTVSPALRFHLAKPQKRHLGSLSRAKSPHNFLTKKRYKTGCHGDEALMGLWLCRDGVGALSERGGGRRALGNGLDVCAKEDVWAQKN